MRKLDPKRLLVIEDDHTISELLAYNLRHAGYEVVQEHDGHSGLKAALSYDIDLAVIDVMLPELDGLAVSREISRRKPDVPIILLTALTERETMLQGFECGADDFIVKPFDLDELLARIAARLRRTSGALGQTDIPVALGGLVLDSDTHLLRTAAGEVFLKPKEYDLLELFLSSPGHLFPREEISHRVWRQKYGSESRTLDVHVRHLRAKLEAVSAPVSIMNVRGVGYRIAAASEEGTK